MTCIKTKPKSLSVKPEVQFGRIRTFKFIICELSFSLRNCFETHHIGKKNVATQISCVISAQANKQIKWRSKSIGGVVQGENTRSSGYFVARLLEISESISRLTFVY